MIAISCYLSLTTEVYSGPEQAGWTTPLLNLTPLVAHFYKTRARVHLVASKLETAIKVFSIGLSTLKWCATGV